MDIVVNKNKKKIKKSYNNNILKDYKIVNNMKNKYNKLNKKQKRKNKNYQKLVQLFNNI